MCVIWSLIPLSTKSLEVKKVVKLPLSLSTFVSCNVLIFDEVVMITTPSVYIISHRDVSPLTNLGYSVRPAYYIGLFIKLNDDAEAPNRLRYFEMCVSKMYFAFM